MSGPRRIVLIGMMGAGKTTVGRYLAGRLGWPLLDNDTMIREATGRDGPAIFREAGQDGLHAAEAQAFEAALAHAEPSIVTVAASVVDDPRLRTLLSRAGHVAWLRASPATLHRRIDTGAGRRADAVDESFLARLAAEREPRYREVADQIVAVDARPVASIADEILAAVADPSAG